MKMIGFRSLPALINIALLISLVVFSAGCTKREEKEIKIGIITPLTGDVASWGEMQRNATELALETVHDLKLEVIFEDDQANPREGLNAFNKLADVDKVPIVIGTPASTVTLTIAPIANQKKVVLLSSGSTATDVGRAGPYVFRIMPSDEVQSTIMADWAHELGYTRIAILYVENAWGRGLMEAFKNDFEQKGGKIVKVQPTEQDASDYRTQLLKIRASNPDAIYAPLYTKGAGLAIKQARELGMKQQILGADVYGAPEFITAGGSAVNGVLYTTFGEYRGAAYQDFARLYKEKYGKAPETYATYCYDAFLIGVEAIRRIPGGTKIDGTAIREQLLKLNNYQGITGLTSFNNSTSAIGKTFDKMMVIDGTFKPYKSKDE